MKHLAFILAAAVLTGGCAPPPEAPNAPYRKPRGAAAVYRGPVNQPQTQHLYHGSFPRLTREEWRLLERFNRQVNHDITYLSDLENYGLPDVHVTEPPIRRPRARGWPPGRYGDCEDFALTKKHRLARAGFSASRMFVVLADTPERGGTVRHSVLAVPEGREWWILDNRHDTIERASSLEKWWDWSFIRPSFTTYRHLADLRRGGGNTTLGTIARRDTTAPAAAETAASGTGFRSPSPRTGHSSRGPGPAE
jgi:predicted transglutaminase-like cysteine proteinase